MHKFQSVNFQDLDDFFEYLPSNELRLVKTLRTLIMDTIPEIKEKISYNVPFYHFKKNICFIWPESIPWGGDISGVQIGFTRGHLLDHAGYLQEGKRQFVRSKSFKRISESDFDILTDLLLQAHEIDLNS